MKHFAKTRSAVVALAALVTILASPAGAQVVNLARIEPGDSRFQIALGLDPAVLATVGYVRGFGLGTGTALWNLDLGMAVAETDIQDLRLRAGLQATVWRKGSLRVAAGSRLIARTTSNSIYDGQGFGADLRTIAGFYRPRWFVTGSIGYERTFVMHIEHSDWYRETIFADAVDGWYRGESGILRGGLAAGFAVGVVEVATRVEWRRLDGGEPLDPPFVGELSFSVPF